MTEEETKPTFWQRMFGSTKNKEGDDGSSTGVEEQEQPKKKGWFSWSNKEANAEVVDNNQLALKAKLMEEIQERVKKLAALDNNNNDSNQALAKIKNDLEVVEREIDHLVGKNNQKVDQQGGRKRRSRKKYSSSTIKKKKRRVKKSQKTKKN